MKNWSSCQKNAHLFPHCGKVVFSMYTVKNALSYYKLYYKRHRGCHSDRSYIAAWAGVAYPRKKKTSVFQLTGVLASITDSCEGHTLLMAGHRTVIPKDFRSEQSVHQSIQRSIAKEKAVLS